MANWGQFFWGIFFGGLLIGCGAGPNSRTGNDVGNSMVNSAPVWNDDEFEIKVCLDKPFNINLDKYVKDPDGDKLTFSAEGLPPWVAVAEGGTFFGAPMGVHIFSEYEIEVTASDGKLESSAQITVKIVGCRRNRDP